MVDCSSICVCFLTDFESGTAVTVDYAIEKGLDVINVAVKKQVFDLLSVYNRNGLAATLLKYKKIKVWKII